jgi:ATP/maltotriose-dependent transcriptional regulator MalT
VAATPSSIIRSKLVVPPRPAPFLARPRVEERLAELITANHVTWVFGTAGAGKTTAIVEAARRVGRPVAWLTVDDSDVAAGRLLIYLEATLAAEVEGVAGTVGPALAGGMDHRETAGLLAEAVGDAEVLLVLDDVERLEPSREALGVVEAFVRYAHDSARIVLASRSELRLELGSSSFPRRVGALTGSELAFTVEEAAAALTELGREDVDPARAVELTNGWVTGVMFEGWRAEAEQSPGAETEPLYEYLSAEILDRLGADDRSFLVNASVLDVVTAERAKALELPDAYLRLESLRRKHLPVTWDTVGRAMWWHPRFREYLLDYLDRQDAEHVADLRFSYGKLLLQEGHIQEAVEQFLLAGEPLHALDPADHVIETIVERLDLDVAERWLAALESVRPTWSPGLSAAEIMLAIARGDITKGIRTIDRLASLGQRGKLARSSTRAAALMTWLYAAAGRPDDAHAVLELANPGAEIDVMRYAMTSTQEHVSEAERVVSLTGGPLDVILYITDYYAGRLRRILEEPPSPWAAKLSEHPRIAALTSLGRTSEAFELYQAALAGGGSALGLRAITGPELLADLGRTEDAWHELQEGREQLRAIGAVTLEWLSLVVEAKLQLRLRRDVEAAKEVLSALEQNPSMRTYRMIFEHVDTWYGLAALLEGDDREALFRLRRAVKSMFASHRTLLLPAACAYLSEAHWRHGEPDEARRFARLALRTAEEQGSNHVLLQALADVPDVATRQLEGDSTADERWHELSRALPAAPAPSS